MRSARSRVLVAAALLALLTVAAFVAIRQSLAGGRLGAIAEARLTAALGQPVTIGDLGVSFFPRVAVTGTDVRIGTQAAQAPAVQIGRIRIVPRLRTIFSPSIAIEEIALDGFVVSALRGRDGRWHVPTAAPAPTADEAAGVVVERVRIDGGRLLVFEPGPGDALVEVAAIDDVEATVVDEQGAVRLAPVTGRIGGAAIAGEARIDEAATQLEFSAERLTDEDLPALVRLLGAERPAFLRLDEPASLSVSARVARASSRLSGKGRLRAPRVTIEPIALRDFNAPFAIDGSTLAFEPTTFGLYGGTHQGRVEVVLADGAPRWSFASRVSGLDLGAFLDALSGREQGIEGTAAATTSLRGRVDEALAQTVAGRAVVTVTDGVIRDFPLLATINRVVRLAEQEGSDTRFESLSATLAIARGEAAASDLVMQAGHVRVEAAGRIGFDRSLDLRGVAVLSRERSAQAIASIRELTGLRNASGEVELPLTIRGTADRPSFGIDLKAALTKGLKDELRRRLRRIIKPPGGDR